MILAIVKWIPCIPVSWTKADTISAFMLEKYRLPS